ncbi:MAG: TonB-dependent receptor, partial [Gemmatimonadaceae bacterium]|nr:TonB-dependent receptor [Gemmatimonadaceae bacterium]
MSRRRCVGVRGAVMALLAGLCLPVQSPWTVSSLVAQGAVAGTSVVRGTVRSQTGRPVPGARVMTSDSAARTLTDSLGRFALNVASTSSIQLTISAVGYRPVAALEVDLRGGSARAVAVTLAPLYVLDLLTVLANPERPLLNTENASTGGSLERAELAALPTDAREPIALLFNVPGVTQATGFFGDAPVLSFNGQNSLYTSYLLDGLDNTEGFLGGPRVEFPLAGLARIDALVNTYSSAYGRSPSGIVNQYSRAGSNQTHGELFIYSRPGTRLGVDGDNPVPFGAQPAAVRRKQEGFRRYQLGGALNGPLINNRTFYSLAAEYADENEDRIGSTALATFLGTERRQKAKLFARVDHAWNSDNVTTVRAAYSLTNRAGTGSGVVTPEADNITQRYGGLYAVTHRTSLAQGRANNTLSVQLGTYIWNFPPRADAGRPQVTVVGPAPAFATQAVVGSTNFVFDERETQWQLRDVFERAIGTSHTFRAGADIVSARFKLFAAGTNPLGSYVVVNNGNISAPSGRPLSFTDVPTSAQVLSYTIDARPQRVNLSQTVYGAFVEDVWKLTPALTVIGGLRWDYDDVTSRGQSSADLTAIQPRASFNWYATPRSVIRGGVGVYAGKFPYATLSDAQQLGPNGNATVTFTGANAPAYLQGPTAATLAAAAGALPPREIFTDFARGLQMSRSYQATVGYQRQVGDDWGVSADVVYSRTVNLPRLLDLNAMGRSLTAADTANLVCASSLSCPGDASRPTAPANNSYRRLSTAETGGLANYAGLYLSARRRLSKQLAIDANYVLSRAMSDAEDINFSATQGNCFSEDRTDAVTGAACNSSEWAVANNDRTHRATLRGVWTPLSQLRLSVVSDAQSGQPFNRVAGVTTAGGQSRYDLLGSGPIRGNSFIGNNDRYFGVNRNGERLPAYFTTNVSVAWTPSVFARQLEVRADLFNAFNATSWSGFATGTGGSGNITQTGRPGDPIYNFTPGPPRQLQLSA